MAGNPMIQQMLQMAQQNPGVAESIMKTLGLPPQMEQMAMAALGGGGGGQPQPQPPMMPQGQMPATDSGIGDFAGEAINAMTPQGQQPNYNNTGHDPYVKFPEGGIEPPYREDQDMAPPGQNNPSDEEELDGVRSAMMKMDPGELAADMQQALESGDDKAVTELLAQMEEAGMSIDDLPPNIQRQIDAGDDYDAGSDEE